MVKTDDLPRAKGMATRALAGADWDALRLADIDPRIEQYCREVSGNPDGHCLWEQLSVWRFYRLLSEGVRIHKVRLRMFYEFYESLWLPGQIAPTHYKLTPVQAYQFANIYGLVDGRGRRLTREAVLFVPRKYSKTTQTAAVVLYDLLFGEANGEAYVGANSQDQAKKCFDVIRGAMRRLDPSGTLYRINEMLIKSLRRERHNLAQCLTSNARTKDGLNASVTVMDEFAQARDNKLLTVLTTSMGIRLEPLTVIITTASDVYDGPFFSMLNGYKEALLSTLDSDTVPLPGVFAHLFEPDVGDEEGNPATWHKVHPHMGVTVSEEFYAREYESARRGGSEAMMAFRTKLLNIYAADERASWISAAQARDVMQPVNLMALPGRPDAMVAVDLSESDDFSAVSTGVRDSDAQSARYHTAYFFPEGALPGHPNESLYRAWAAAGHLHLLPGDVIDYRAIVDYILGLVPYVNILGIGYDPYKSHEMINMLAAVGADLGAGDYIRPIKQTYGNFTAAVQSFEHGVKTKRLVIDDNPINAYCFGNAVLDYDSLDNCKPIKRRHTQKIDGVITMLMCQRMFLDYVNS